MKGTNRALMSTAQVASPCLQRNRCISRLGVQPSSVVSNLSTCLQQQGRSAVQVLRKTAQGTLFSDLLHRPMETEEGEGLPFQFNFGSRLPAEHAAQPTVPAPDGSGWLPAEEILISRQATGASISGHGAGGPTVTQYASETLQLPGGTVLVKGSLPGSAASDLLKVGDLADSDLVPRRYEGGFKLWECALDLAGYLCQQYQINSSPDGRGMCSSSPSLSGSSVLELGCGQGLPGILLMLCGASVHFQDYNKEVLTELCAANVAANIAARSALPEGQHRAGHCNVAPAPRYFAGSWAGLPDLLEKEGLRGTYDMILSAETIYSTDSQRQLLACIKQCLKPGTGKAWIAAKSYYFGVGGGTASFRRLLATDGTFDAGVAAVHNDGASNKREILLLTFRGLH